MDVTIPQEKLAKALSNIGRVASSRAGLEILANILLRTNGKNLYIAATNLEIASSQTIPVKVDKEGSITIPAKLVNELITGLPKEPIHLVAKNNTLYIKTERHTASIRGASDEEFPELPVVDTTESVNYSLSVIDFKEAAEQTVICASSDTTRPVLTGVYWHTHQSKLYFAATDGYRLAEKCLIDVTSDVSAILPASTIQEVLRSINDTIDVIDISFDETQVTFIIGQTTITSKLIDGNFPDYRQLLPEHSKTQFTVKKTELQQNIKITSLFARDNGGTISLQVDTDSKTVTVNSIHSQTGENTSSIQINSIDGQSGDITFNSRYLLDALSVMNSDRIEFAFSEKLSPIVIKQDRNTSYQHIIMPIKS